MANLINPFGDATQASPSRYDLFIDTYAPEVQAQYQYNLFISRMVQQQMIESGTSKRFMITGRIGSYKHNFGDSFYGLDMEQAYRTIHLDDRPQATGVEYEDLVTMIEQVPAVRAQYTVQMADALSSWVEVETLKMLYAAGRTAANANADTSFYRGSYDWEDGDFADGSAPTPPTDVTENAAGAQNLLEYIDAYVVALENEGINPTGLNCVVSPKLWQEVFKLDQVNDTATSASGANAPTAGNVSIFADMNINSNPLSISEYYDYVTPLRYNGVSIWKHNMWNGSARSSTGFAQNWTAVANPHAAVSSADNRNGFNTTNCSAILFKGDAIGLVNKMGPTVKIETPSRTDNELIRAKVWIGGGTLKPELATVFHKA